MSVLGLLFIIVAFLGGALLGITANPLYDETMRALSGDLHSILIVGCVLAFLLAIGEFLDSLTQAGE